MKLNRRYVIIGLATLGLVGGLAGGGAALAASDGSGTTATNVGICRGNSGMVFGMYSQMTAAARYLGMSRTELAEQMHANRPLGEIARAQGKTVAGLEKAMVAGMRVSLATDPSLTAKDRAAILARMQRHLDAMATGHMAGGRDMDDIGSEMMGGSGNDMMGGAGKDMMSGPDRDMMGQ